MQDSKEWIKTLKPGDEVICKTWRRAFHSAVTKVEKITPAGFVKVDGNLYEPKTGKRRGGGGEIIKATKEARFEIHKAATILKAKRILSEAANKDLTYERALAIIKIFTEEPKQEAAQGAARYADNQTLKEAT